MPLGPKGQDMKANLQNTLTAAQSYQTALQNCLNSLGNDNAGQTWNAIKAMLDAQKVEVSQLQAMVDVIQDANAVDG